MPTQQTINKYANELLNLFVELYSGKYGTRPVINRFKQKWGFIDMYEDLGMARSKEVINFYFKGGRPGHTVEGLLYNYERLDQTLKDIEKDEEDRKKIRLETKKRLEEWESRGNS